LILWNSDGIRFLFFFSIVSVSVMMTIGV
jgi:hypothetical protein